MTDQLLGRIDAIAKETDRVARNRHQNRIRRDKRSHRLRQETPGSDNPPILEAVNQDLGRALVGEGCPNSYAAGEKPLRWSRSQAANAIGTQRSRRGGAGDAEHLPIVKDEGDRIAGIRIRYQSDI